MQKSIFLIFLIGMSLNSFGQKIPSIKSVNFIQEGEVSKLIIDLTDHVVVDKKHIKNDKQIILDLKNVVADSKFMRGVDTSEFSGATVYISPYKKPGSKNDLRFAIQLRDNVRSFIENKGSRVVLNIENRFGVFTRSKLKQVKDDEFLQQAKADGQKVLVPKSNNIDDILQNLTQSGVKRYVGKRISINVNSISYSEVLKLIGDTSGFNIIIDDEVGSLKPLTISLTNLPWDQVLDTIMSLGNLVALKYGNILSIKTAEKARQEKQAELEAKDKNKALEPLLTKIFPVSYAELPAIKTILDSYTTPQRGSIQLDNRTQQLIVKDTIEVIERMKKIIETLDTQTPQILIEGRVVEAEENYSLRAGLTNGLQASYDPFTNSGSLDGFAGTGAFEVSSAPSASATSFLSIGGDANPFSIGRFTNLAFTLELMESESKGKIISSPKVVTSNNEPATLSSTIQRRFLTFATDTNGNSVPSYQSVDAQISLEVTPKVTNEGAIAMDVSIQKTGFGVAETDTEIPPTTSRNITTKVLVENGSTVVIGGLYETNDQELEAGVPFLKDLPIIGWLFRSAYQPSKTRKELIVFITPRIVNQEEAGLVNRELSSELGL